MPGPSPEERRHMHLLKHQAHQAARQARRSALQGWGAPAPDTSHLRIGDTERNRVADALQAHFAEGRLDAEELDDRLTRALSAKTQGDLAGLMDDLPGPAPWEAAPRDPGYRTRGHGVHGHGRLRFVGFAFWALFLVVFPLAWVLGAPWFAFAVLRVLFVVWLGAMLFGFIRRRTRGRNP